jgi:hypothetical protein
MYFLFLTYMMYVKHNRLYDYSNSRATYLWFC